MAEIKFMYKKVSHTYPCEKNDLIKDIFELYSKKISIEIDALSFYYKNKKIEYDEQTLIEDIFGYSNNKTIKIRVKKTPFYITFFNNRGYLPISITAKKTDKMKKIFEDYANKAKKNYSQILFIYMANFYTNYNIGNKTVNEFADEKDKISNNMSIIVVDLEEEKEEEKMKNQMMDQ